jgi:DNA-binding NtrC family response regulator
MAGEKVLLVDDEEEFTHILSERMKARGLTVVTAQNGRAALEKTKEESFDAIILDMLMPEMGGIETLKRLLEISPDLQIIILTGHATVEKGVEAVKLGAMDFLEKPADIDKLMAKIKEAKAEKMVLVEKRSEAKIKKILKSKGW